MYSRSRNNDYNAARQRLRTKLQSMCHGYKGIIPYEIYLSMLTEIVSEIEEEFNCDISPDYQRLYEFLCQNKPWKELGLYVSLSMR